MQTHFPVEHGKPNGEDDDGSDFGDETSFSSRICLQLAFPIVSLEPPDLFMNCFMRFTSDSFTGFTIYSFAPSSKHLIDLQHSELVRGFA